MLVKSNAFKHPRFNLSSLALSPSCSESIKGFIQMVATNFLSSSEQKNLERVIRLICQETTPEAIGIRRCTVLAYELICSLQDDDQNPHHQSLGTQLMERGKPWVRVINVVYQARRYLCFVVCVCQGGSLFHFAIKMAYFLQIQNTAVTSINLAHF